MHRIKLSVSLLALLVAATAVTFTILTNDGQDAIVKQALDALKSATQEPTA